MTHRTCTTTKLASRCRVTLVVAVGAACAYCSGIDQRQPHTSVAVGGGAAQGYHRTFGCQGQLTHHEAQSFTGGGIEIDHEGDSGLLLGGAAVVQHATVQEVSQTNRPPQTQIASETQYWNNAAHARVGWTLGWAAMEFGGSALPDLKTVFPYFKLRLGGLNRGLSGELQVGGATRPWDPITVAAGVRYGADAFTVRFLAATLHRPMRSHQNVAGAFVPDRSVNGSYFNGGDPGLVTSAEIKVDDAFSVRLDAVAAISWGATAWLVWNSEPERKVKARDDGAEVPIPAPAADHPPVPEPEPVPPK